MQNLMKIIYWIKRRKRFNLIKRIQEKCEQKKEYKNGIILRKRIGKTIIGNGIQNFVFAIVDPRSGIFISSVYSK